MRMVSRRGGGFHAILCLQKQIDNSVGIWYTVPVESLKTRRLPEIPGTGRMVNIEFSGKFFQKEGDMLNFSWFADICSVISCALGFVPVVRWILARIRNIKKK